MTNANGNGASAPRKIERERLSKYEIVKRQHEAEKKRNQALQEERREVFEASGRERRAARRAAREERERKEREQEKRREGLARYVDELSSLQVARQERREEVWNEEDRRREAANDWENEDDEWELVGKEFLPKTIAQYVRKVNDAYDRAIDGIIATGQALIEMQAGVDHGEWLLLFERKITRFGIRTAEKLMKIAGHAALSNSQNSAKLPRSPDALEFISTIKPNVVQAMIDKGIISPTTTIEQARRLPAVALPKALDALFEIVMREDPAETAETTAHHLWWLHMQKDRGDGATQNLLNECAGWLAAFSTAYQTIHEQNRSEWLAEADEAAEQKRKDKEMAKFMARSRKPYFPRKSRRRSFGRSKRRGFIRFN